MLRSRVSLPLAVAIAAATLGFQGLAAPASASTDCGGSVTVDRGDTLNRIAGRCGVSLSDLLRENPQLSNPNIVPVGTQLTLPGGSADADDGTWEAASQQVESEAGDTLASIADRHGIPLAILIAANPDVHPEELDTGTIVGLPDS